MMKTVIIDGTRPIFNDVDTKICNGRLLTSRQLMAVDLWLSKYLLLLYTPHIL